MLYYLIYLIKWHFSVIFLLCNFKWQLTHCIIGAMAIKSYSTFPWSPELEPHYQMQFSVRVDLGVMAIKSYSTFPWSPELEPHYQMQFSVRVDLGVMAIKSYSTFSWSPELEPHYQMQFSFITRTLHWGGILPFSRGYSQHILSFADRQNCNRHNDDLLNAKHMFCLICQVVIYRESGACVGNYLFHTTGSIVWGQIRVFKKQASWHGSQFSFGIRWVKMLEYELQLKFFYKK